MAAFGICILAGVGLGLRFKVFVLGPVMTMAAAVSIAAGVSNAQDARAIAFDLLGILVCIQIGYIAGCILLTFRPEPSLRSSGHSQDKI